MKEARAVLTTIGIWWLFSSLFWLLLTLATPQTALGISRSPVPLPAHYLLSEQLHTAPPESPPTLGGAPAFPSPTSQVEDGATGVTWGPIEIIAGGEDLAGKDLTSEAAATSLDLLANDLALAMDVDLEDLDSAELMCADSICTDPAGSAVMGLAPGTWFPTRGASFALLSTGTVTGRPEGGADVAEGNAVVHGIGRPSVASAEFITKPQILQGLKNSENGDVVRLHLSLTPPVTATCFALDYTFYSTDLPYTDTAATVLPASVGAGSTDSGSIMTGGDLFTAQVGAADLHVEVNGTVAAPGNIAFNSAGEVVASSTMSPSGIYAALKGPAGVNIAGVFPLLQMRSPVTGGMPFDLYLSIQDRGDSLGDSAVALDNFAWLEEPDPAACDPKAGYSGDRDGDGLPDGWEQHGVYALDGASELQHLDLSAWGADPDIKDVFVEIDAMRPITEGGYDPTPIPNAIARIVDAFARAPIDQIDDPGAKGPPHFKGVHLHVDYGHDAPMTWADRAGGPVQAWGTVSGGGTLAGSPVEQLCGEECADSLNPLWATIDRIKRDNFDLARSQVFHYTLFAHELAPCTVAMMEASEINCADNEQISGISRNLLPTEHGASDLVVSLGSPEWSKSYTQTELAQAGTFMHELGHNLGLNHYGTIESQDNERLMHKPNHLSVMNYLYQTDGLVVSDPMFMFDYSRYKMAPLIEDALSEEEGIKMAESRITLTYTLGVRHFCQSTIISVTENADKVDWNCVDGVDTATVTHTINGDVDEMEPFLPIYSHLAAVNEWERLVYTGGMLNRQRSMLQPLIVVRMPLHLEADEHTASDQAGVTGEAAPTGENNLAFQHILVVQQPVSSTGVDQLVAEELRDEQDKGIPRYHAAFPAWRDFLLMSPSSSEP